MADFVAVLRKTIDGLAENNPAMREKVYAKARATIAAKLAAVNPPPPPAVLDRQKRALEDAITEVELGYTLPASDSGGDDLDNSIEFIFAGMNEQGAKTPVEADGVTPAASGGSAPAATPVASRPVAAPAQAGSAEAPKRYFGPEDDPHPDTPDRRPAMASIQPPPPPARNRSRTPVGLLVGLVALLVVAGAAYGVWLNRDDLRAAIGLAPGELASGSPAAIPASEPVANETGTDEAGTDMEEPEELAAGTAEDTASQAAPDSVAPAEDEADIAAIDPPGAIAPATAPTDPGAAASPPSPVDPDSPRKFTQRLTPDGREVDDGPAGGTPAIGEGTSVATATSAAPSGTEAQQPAGAPPAAASPAETDEAEPAIAVGQRAIFYEERTNSTEGSAETGSIVWSLVQESPGGEQPPEPAIRAEATIPDKDLQLRMTIRRNGDRTLPASHIVEMIFLAPDDFEGGGIDNVLRMTMKASEEAAGRPLLGIPAKIAEGFFLLALTDGPSEVEANTTLLRSESWIDIPIVYASGRRALITMEKGIPGNRVFEDALKAWQSASSGG